MPVIVTNKQLQQLLLELNSKMDAIMTAQDDINAAVAAFGTILTDLQAQVTQLGADVAALAALLAAGQPVDTTALNAITATAAGIQSSLDSAVSSVTALAPPPAG